MSKNKKTKKSDIFSLVKKFMEEKHDLKSPRKNSRISIGAPAYNYKEITQSLDSLLDVWISMGPKVKTFEEQAANYVGTKYAVAVNSGSSANLLALKTFIILHKISPRSEVIIPATTFATVVSPILQLGLIPIYVDVDANSWNIDPIEVEKAISKKTRVIMPVHTFGNPANMKRLQEIARKYNLLILEDACEAHGAEINGKKVPSFGDMGTWSFFVAHNITTGEGGMIFTDNKDYRDILVSLREFGRIPTKDIKTKPPIYEDKLLGKYDSRYVFNHLGYNMRMTDIAASLGIEQLKKLDKLNRKRISLVNKYLKHLKNYREFIVLPKVQDNTFHSFYGFPFVIKENAPFTRLELAKFLEERNIETRPFFAGSLPDQPGYINEPHRNVGGLKTSRWLRDNGLFIGCHPMIQKDQVEHLIQTFDDFFLEKK
jgi:CDP-4-dehydro-6-deoxyglucose reductase, E1